MMAENRFNNSKFIDLRKDPLFRPELQGLFTKAEQVGFVGYIKDPTKSKIEDKVMVLTPLGLLMIETTKVSFKSGKCAYL